MDLTPSLRYRIMKLEQGYKAWVELNDLHPNTFTQVSVAAFSWFMPAHGPLTKERQWR